MKCGRVSAKCAGVSAKCAKTYIGKVGTRYNMHVLGK